MRQLLLTICSLCAFLSFGQNFFPPIVNYSNKDYGKDRNPETYCVVQDHRGVMYFGTSHGVLEFDGEQWNFIKVNFDSFVRSIAVNDEGVIFTGTYGDFGYLSADASGQYSYQSLLDKVPPEDQFFSDVWQIHTTGQHVYFQTEEALFDYSTATEKIEIIYPQTSFHTSFLIDSTIYLRQREVGLVRLEETQLIELDGTELFKIYGVFGLHALKDDSLLIVTQELGLFKWKNGQMRALPELNSEPLSEMKIIGSTVLSNGDIALNTLTHGAIVVNLEGRILKRVNRSIGIRSDVVFSLYQYRDLNVWLTLENGI